MIDAFRPNADPKLLDKGVSPDSEHPIQARKRAELLRDNPDAADLAKELAALIRKEGVGPWLAVGHSMGGPIAARTVLEDRWTWAGSAIRNTVSMPKDRLRTAKGRSASRSWPWRRPRIRVVAPI